MKTTGIAGLLLLITSISAVTRKPKTEQPAKFKTEFLKKLNAARSKGCNCGLTYMPPAPPLQWNDLLESAALQHAEDMSRNGYFSHIGRNGQSVSDRVIAAGYSFRGYKAFAVGENIAKGQTNIDEVTNGWLNSPGHCKNIMNPAFREVGVAKAGDCWVEDFGGRQPFSSREQQLLRTGRYRLVEEKK